MCRKTHIRIRNTLQRSGLSECYKVFSTDLRETTSRFQDQWFRPTVQTIESGSEDDV